MANGPSLRCSDRTALGRSRAQGKRPNHRRRNSPVGDPRDVPDERSPRRMRKLVAVLIVAGATTLSAQQLSPAADSAIARVARLVAAKDSESARKLLDSL